MSEQVSLKEAFKKKNEKVLERCVAEGEERNSISKSIKAKFGVDPINDTAKFNFAEGKVSWQKLRTKLEEADSASTFTQFLRAGIHQITAGMYKATPVTYTEIVTVVQSDKDTELYAPMQGVAFPREVGRQEKYPEVAAAALDIELKNKKYGSIYALEKELLNDDQTSEFARQTGLMGEYLAILTEVLVYGKIASVANMQYINFVIPQSETKPSYEANYPWSTAFRGGGANRPAAYGALTPANIQAGLTGLMNQKNLQGIKMLVQPDRLIVGPTLQWDAATILNSSFYPAGAATTAGNMTGAFAVNVLKNIVDLTVSRFVVNTDGAFDGNSKAWYLADTKKPYFVVQMRDPISVVQEQPESGQGFEQDIIRFKASSRLNADWIDPRFAWQGSDGSV